jgi:hypothetical protein
VIRWVDYDTPQKLSQDARWSTLEYTGRKRAGPWDDSAAEPDIRSASARQDAGAQEMTLAHLLIAAELPEGFRYPHAFLRTVELGLVNLEPWWVLHGDLLRARQAGVRTRYPTRTLVPFARRQDNDDVACFDVDTGTVVIVHDFADPGWEQRAAFNDFYGWLRHAIDEFVEFDVDQ